MTGYLRKVKNRIIEEKKKIGIDLENRAVNKIISDLLSKSEHPRIYHYHIRKTAGTSVNFAFLNNSGEKDVKDFYTKLAAKPNHRLISKNKNVFVGWNTQLINEQNYFYAFSHNPMHKLSLSTDIFTITCLRDPLKRVVSHYNMLKYFQQENIKHPCMETEGLWLGNSFNNFIENLPEEHLLNQIYMFSEFFDMNEAFDNISSCSYILHTETLQEEMKTLGNILHLNLPLFSEKKYGYIEILPQESLDKLREKLEPEYRLMEMLSKA